MPTGKIPIICAAQNDAGTRFAAEHADYNFCTGGGVNQPTAVAPSAAVLSMRRLKLDAIVVL